MVTASHSVKNSPNTFKNVPSFSEIQADLPSDTILIEMLKPLEQKLQTCLSMRKFREETFYPLWFMAETERNVYLWRNSFSIGDHTQFQFWVSVEKLIERRILQLQSFSDDNLFLSPEIVSNPLLFQRKQIEYLEAFRQKYQKIKVHAHALSLTGAMLNGEQSGHYEGHVILPARRKQCFDKATL